MARGRGNNSRPRRSRGDNSNRGRRNIAGRQNPFVEKDADIEVQDANLEIEDEFLDGMTNSDHDENGSGWNQKDLDVEDLVINWSFD